MELPAVNLRPTLHSKCCCLPIRACQLSRARKTWMSCVCFCFPIMVGIDLSFLIKSPNFLLLSVYKRSSWHMCLCFGLQFCSPPPLPLCKLLFNFGKMKHIGLQRTRCADNVLKASPYQIVHQRRVFPKAVLFPGVALHAALHSWWLLVGVGVGWGKHSVFLTWKMNCLTFYQFPG